METLEELGEGEGSWDLVVLDKRAVGREELDFWRGFAPVLAVDEGGEAREAADYLLDILPRLSSRPLARDIAPNLASIGYLELPRARREPPAALSRILISFGGEDPAGIAIPLARLLVSRGLAEPERVTLVLGALNEAPPPEGLEGLTVLGPVQDLKEHLHRYDLVLTQFGLTAFEAAWAGCAVALVNPSAYHRELSRAAGFAELGIGEADPRRLEALFREPTGALVPTRSLAGVERSSLAALVSSLSPSGPHGCPACRSVARGAVHRERGRSFFRCADCGCLYLERFGSLREDPYREGYFFEEYKAQYGKTYLEDWPTLSAHARGRLELLEPLLEGGAPGSGRAAPKLLDVGCAYGPFLAAAKERGWDCLGLEPVEEAVRHVRFELDIPALVGDFADPACEAALGGGFDALSMWYVIEHFVYLDEILARAARLLVPGGLLAFSTPSGSGISARSDLSGFLSRSPEDHFSVLEPGRIAGILARQGFRVERIRVTGHHPERFPAVAALPEGLPRRLAARLAAFASRRLGLGDTFEVYARKLPGPEAPQTTD